MFSKNKSINERVFLITGSRGLLYVDKTSGIESLFDIDRDCVTIHNNYIIQIRNILDNYGNYVTRRYNGYVKSLNYTWNKWGDFVYSKIINF